MHIDYTKSWVAMGKWVQDIPDLDISTLLNAPDRGIKYIPFSCYIDMTLQVFHRSYISPVKGQKISDDRCFCCKGVRADIYHVTNYVPFKSVWAIFGCIDPNKLPCTPGSRKLLQIQSAAEVQTILHTWNHAARPLFKLFLEKPLFIIKMDWVEASLKHTYGDFWQLESFIALVPYVYILDTCPTFNSGIFLTYYIVSGENLGW